MHSATLHGVGVITKLYFAIFAAFEESTSLNLAQSSFKVMLWKFLCRNGILALSRVMRMKVSGFGTYGPSFKMSQVTVALSSTLALYMYTVSQKNCANLFFCQNFVKIRPIVKIFCTKIAKRTCFSEVYLFSTSPNLCQRTTV